MLRAASIPSCEGNSFLILKHQCPSSNEDLEAISQTGGPLIIKEKISPLVSQFYVGDLGVVVYSST